MPKRLREVASASMTAMAPLPSVPAAVYMRGRGPAGREKDGGAAAARRRQRSRPPAGCYRAAVRALSSFTRSRRARPLRRSSKHGADDDHDGHDHDDDDQVVDSTAVAVDSVAVFGSTKRYVSMLL